MLSAASSVSEWGIDFLVVKELICCPEFLRLGSGWTPEQNLTPKSAQKDSHKIESRTSSRGPMKYPLRSVTGSAGDRAGRS
jgi:hypothetical protein